MRDNLQRLQSMRLRDGRTLEVVTLPFPATKYAHGMRLPGSYLNFYLTNASVLVPQYEDPHDALACQTLAELFPGRHPVGIDCRALIGGLGAIHCLTQQIPAAQV